MALRYNCEELWNPLFYSTSAERSTWYSLEPDEAKGQQLYVVVCIKYGAQYC